VMWASASLEVSNVWKRLCPLISHTEYTVWFHAFQIQMLKQGQTPECRLSSLASVFGDSDKDAQIEKFLPRPGGANIIHMFAEVD
jgi:hypothetical protein